MVGLVLFTAMPAKVTAITNPEVYEDSVLQKPSPEQIEQAQIAYYDALSKKLTAKAESLVGTQQGQCVVAVREFLGVGKDEVSGWATSTRINSKVPEVGSIIVFWGSRRNKYGHVGIVLFTTSDGYVYYYSPNNDFKGHPKIQKVKIKSKTIKGYRIVPINIVLLA